MQGPGKAPDGHMTARSRKNSGSLGGSKLRKGLLGWPGLALLMLMAAALPGEAQAQGFALEKFSREAGLRFAYGKSLQKASVHLYCLFPRWGLFLSRPGQGWLGPLGLSAVVEGVIGGAEAESPGWEVGLTPLLKLSVPLRRRALLFLEGGAGVIWECINSPAIGHTFNFTPQVGAGVEVALGEHWGLTFAYRFRHSSNAGLYKENPAFNVGFLQFGLTCYY
ncbi:MAG: acyloxyacyl hydrolase [Deltaproteobacteria bacterium]|nr:acyloxyacyl hydrolase [Deltaproteobacteria bacterium]